MLHTRLSAWGFACAFLGMGGLLACGSTSNPVTGRPEFVFMSEKKERELGDESAEQVESQMGLAQDSELQAYVEEIGQRLARHSPRRGVNHRFQVVEMDEPNAFALPDGRIYVSRGLVVLTNSESELANVIAHEIGHVAARHAAQRDAHQKSFGLATLASRIAGGKQVDDGESIGGIDGIYAYSRNQERQADEIGMELSGASGYDPQGMGRFLRSLDRAGRLSQGYSMPQFYFMTHPATGERVAEATATAEARRHSKPAPRERDALDHLARLNGMPAVRPASEGVFIGHRFLHADLAFSLRFPKGWETSNQSSQVVAISPKRDAIVILQLAGEGEDPEEAAHRDAEELEFQIERPRRVRVGGHAGYRGEVTFPSAYGPVYGSATWVALEGRVYRLVCGVEKGDPGRYEGTCRSFARSLRPLGTEAASEITELRIRLVSAREGETLRELNRRVGGEWSVNRTAIINGLQVDDVLSDNDRVKVVKRESVVADLDPDSDPTLVPENLPR